MSSTAQQDEARVELATRWSVNQNLVPPHRRLRLLDFLHEHRELVSEVLWPEQPPATTRGHEPTAWLEDETANLQAFIDAQRRITDDIEVARAGGWPFAHLFHTSAPTEDGSR